MISRDLVTWLVVAGGVTFIVFANLAQQRAIGRRQPTVRLATGVAQWLPYFLWMPYVVVGARIGPELDVGDGWRALGIGISLLGVAIALWSIVTLGRHYDLVLEIHADHQLVRGGPFAMVRHPVYSGLALHFVGACVATGNVVLAAGTLLVTFPSFWIRARAEEVLLRERFGGEYDRYAREVPMLVPRVGGKR